MAGNAETPSYSPPAKKPYKGGSRASYTPSASINEHSYGKDRGKANAQTGNVPSVQVGGSFETAALPKAFTGNFSIGENKNVSEIVGY
jgi:hypothetical protein